MRSSRNIKVKHSKSLKEAIGNIDLDLIVQEAMYGFIMALTFTTAVQFGLMHFDSRAQLLGAIVAMNFVWGSIDMYIFYHMDVNLQHRQLNLLRELSVSSDRESYRKRMYEELGGTIFDSADEESKQEAVDVLINCEPEDLTAIVKDRRWMVLNSVAAFLVTLATVIPFLICLDFIADLRQALMWSMVSASICLFGVGYFLAPYQRFSGRIGTAALITVSALLLTLFAAYLGG